MDKYTITSWNGETIPLQVEWDSDIVADATINVYDADTVMYTKTVPFSDRTADLSVDAGEIPVGKYGWLVKVEYPDGVIDLLPEAAQDCNECEKPLLIVKEVPYVS